MATGCSNPNYSDTSSCGTEGEPTWSGGACEEWITEREVLYTTYPWVDWNNSGFDILFTGCDEQAVPTDGTLTFTAYCSANNGVNGMYFGRDQNWYATTPGDVWYQSPRTLGDDTAYHIYSTDIYKLIAFVQWSIRSTRVFDCSYIFLDVGMVYKLPAYRGSGFQTIVNNILNVTEISDITQPNGGISIKFGGTFYGYAGSPCDNESTSNYDCTWTIAESDVWDDFPTHQHKYDLDNNRYADQDNTYSHTDMPWDPLVDVS